MSDKDKKESEEKMRLVEDILKEFGLTEEMLDPGKIKKAVLDLVKAWTAKEKLDDEVESLKYSNRVIWSLLPSISALSATLLVVATFNRDLIEITSSVRLILTILLVLIPLGIWGNFIDSKNALDSGWKRLVQITKEGTDKDISDRIKEARKPSILGLLPFFINFIFTIAIILIILLIWRVDLIGIFIK